ncbi:STAS domain-containing protein [Saccharopolyspora indica]|uniref:STAS domain-containing protein n=1 Tax=Saccharopolyspora indica TaxID=1229659 RepID=UPI0022EB0821|nr:STAS domain-containing protein [Saccharopolyspora indica]MDA3646776.1 STAS domain-containing protein [Saccharopolyspora indica]
MDFGVTSTRLPDDVALITVSGEIDVSTAPTLRDRLTDAVNDGAHRLVVDLTQVEFLDSTALGVLVGALKRIRAVDGDVVLVCTADRLLKIFRITRLTEVFPIVPDLPSAQAWRG